MYFPLWRTISYINIIFCWTLVQVAVIRSINIKSNLCHKTSHRCKNSDPSMLRLSCVCWKDALAAAEEVSHKTRSFTPPPSIHFDMRVQTMMTSQHAHAWLRVAGQASGPRSSAAFKLSHLSPQIHSISPQPSFISAPEIDPAGVGREGRALSKGSRDIKGEGRERGGAHLSPQTTERVTVN